MPIEHSNAICIGQFTYVKSRNATEVPTINDLSIDDELDSSAMVAVSGGRIGVSTTLWAVLRDNPAFLIRCAAIQHKTMPSTRVTHCCNHHSLTQSSSPISIGHVRVDFHMAIPWVERSSQHCLPP